MEVASHSLRCSHFVRSDRAWPLSDEGHKSSALRIVGWSRSCWRWWEVDAVSAICFHQTRSSTLGSAASAFPPSLGALSIVGDGAPGARIPAPSVRLSLGSHDVERWRVEGLFWKTLPPPVAKSVCWRWMVGGHGKMFGWWWGAGRVVDTPRKPANPNLFEWWFTGAMAMMVAASSARQGRCCWRCPGAWLILIYLRGATMAPLIVI